ncbi:MAG TPA: hypothetical protein VN893_24555 [Bryobacteraceae bacterium]|jgi:hypothetical protein|nr:hypothetical protein [Bryobacteraceae bacterium]
MKKLRFGLLAVALSLPFAFGATQAPATTQTAPSKTAKKQTKSKRINHSKKPVAQSKPAPQTPASK